VAEVRGEEEVHKLRLLAHSASATRLSMRVAYIDADWMMAMESDEELVFV
jgi:hypothetical protein